MIECELLLWADVKGWPVYWTNLVCKVRRSTNFDWNLLVSYNLTLKIYVFSRRKYCHYYHHYFERYVTGFEKIYYVDVSWVNFMGSILEVSAFHCVCLVLISVFTTCPSDTQTWLYPLPDSITRPIPSSLTHSVHYGVTTISCPIYSYPYWYLVRCYYSSLTNAHSPKHVSCQAHCHFVP